MRCDECVLTAVADIMLLGAGAGHAVVGLARLGMDSVCTLLLAPLPAAAGAADGLRGDRIPLGEGA
jgi:hypothetical protein